MSATDSGASGLADQLAQEEPARFWRSLEERARTPAFRQALAREFPEISERFATATDRRTALKLLGASLLMSGIGVARAAEGIAPYVRQPEELIPGKPQFYATTLSEAGFGFGAIAEAHEGRPTKIEGNPNHPASLGGTSPVMQASVFSLYEPDRSRVVRRGSEPSSWGAFQAEIDRLRTTALPRGGAGIGIVLGPQTSPTVLKQLADLTKAMPELRIYRHAPLAGPAIGTTALAHFDKADVIVSLDADFLGEGPARLAMARAFSDGRRVRRSGSQVMNRLYCLESVPSLTGAAADEHMLVRPSAFDRKVAQVANAIASGAEDPFLSAMSQDVRRAGNRALFLAGDRASAFVTAMARELNSRIGALGQTVSFIEAVATGTPDAGSLYDLADAIEGGEIDTLFALDCDLVHSAPGDLQLAGALAKLQRLYHYGLHYDETAQKADWHVPATHELESWGDIRAFDGTASIVQPLIAPLYDGRTLTEMLATLAGDYVSSSLDLVRRNWQQLDDDQWRQALRSGVITGTAFPAITPPVASAPSIASTPAADFDVVLVPDPYLVGGANAANLFLQELPRPLSKLVWGNAAEMAPSTAKTLGVNDGDLVEIAAGETKLALPAMLTPGLAHATIAVGLGFGRPVTHGNEAVGINAYPLRRRDGEWLLAGAGVRRIEGTGRLVTTQDHHAMEGRDIVREVNLADFAKGPAEPEPETQPSLYPPVENAEEAWGMSIDLTSCIGCMACVSACQTENNSPVVGPDEVARGHDMHWLRVDRYYSGEPEAPQTVFQPIPCMQCEDAPCEVVCPVNATVHTHDGLNAQVYNRCVGTRYCSQNCPYKVRRFNFFDYQDYDEGSPLSLLMNPNVTVRSRGVMEKCTYCVQRISAGRIDAEITDAAIPDGRVQTACQQACPTRAITFGNIKDQASAVSREKREPHSYALLAELNTRPRTTYLARVTNRAQDEDNNA